MSDGTVGGQMPTPDELHHRLQRAIFNPSPAKIGHNGGLPLQGESKIPGWITEAQFARQLGLSITTVRRWRRRGYGPTWVKIGRRDYTRETAAADFAAAQLADAEAAAEPRRRGRPRRAR
jgi:hypothetical protein